MEIIFYSISFLIIGMAIMNRINTGKLAAKQIDFDEQLLRLRQEHVVEAAEAIERYTEMYAGHVDALLQVVDEHIEHTGGNLSPHHAEMIAVIRPHYVHQTVH